MTKAKTSKEKNTSDFVTCWLPIIFLGIGSILISIRNFSFLYLFYYCIIPFMAALTFILRKNNKKIISLIFSIVSLIICSIAFCEECINPSRHVYSISSLLICNILLILFVALPDTKIKSFFFIVPLVAYIYFRCFSYWYSDAFFSLGIYLAGFLTIRAVPTFQEKSNPKDSSAALSRLENISKLKEQGILTEDEFQKKKAEIMEQM